MRPQNLVFFNKESLSFLSQNESKLQMNLVTKKHSL